ncbi:hypothetical protein SPHINGOT1_120316 [Sphingomonas sp. T1]|nr:hypothetical protein SPHINGOT1_120316 [Sphingomonas sp. T1]
MRDADIMRKDVRPERAVQPSREMTADDAIADCDLGHARTDRHDLAHAFGHRNAGFALSGAVGAAQQLNVAAYQADETRRYQRFAGTGDRRGPGRGDKSADAVLGTDVKGFHRNLLLMGAHDGRVIRRHVIRRHGDRA